MKQFSKRTLAVGLAFGLMAASSISASAESSFTYAGGKSSYDKKIADAAANLAAKKIGNLRGTFKNFDKNAFISEEELKSWNNS